MYVILCVTRYLIKYVDYYIEFSIEIYYIIHETG